MIIRSAKVPLSPSSALQTMYFWSASASSDRVPLDAGREARAAAAAQPARRHLVDDRLRRPSPAPGAARRGRRAPRTPPATAGRSARSGRRSAGSAGRRTGSPRPARAPADARRSRRRTARRRPPAVTGPKAVAARRGLDLDQRLQPDHPARCRCGPARPRRRAAPPRRATASATASAPSARAAASRGTKILMPRLLQRRRDPLGVGAADQPLVDHRRRPAGAEPEAVDRLHRHRPVRASCRASRRRAAPASPPPPPRRPPPGRPRPGRASARAARPARRGSRGRRTPRRAPRPGRGSAPRRSPAPPPAARGPKPPAARAGSAAAALRGPEVLVDDRGDFLRRRRCLLGRIDPPSGWLICHGLDPPISIPTSVDR